MSFELIAVQVIAPHPVVPFVQRNYVIVNNPSRIDDSLQESIPLVVIQLEF